MRLVPASLVLATSVACAATDTAESPRYSARDSVGVRIVTSTAPSWRDSADAWTLTPDAVTIGGHTADTLYELHNVLAVIPLAHGRIAVVNGGQYSVRVYDSTGKFLNAVGRRGHGPGEYNSISFAVRYRGDSILVSAWGRNTVFASDGSGHRIIALEKAKRDIGEGAQSGFGSTAIASFEDGSLLTYATIFQGGRHNSSEGPVGDGFYTDSLEYHRFTPDGKHSNSLGIFDEYDREVRQAEHYVRVASPERVFAIRGAVLFTGNGREFEVRSYATDGSLSRVVRVTTPAIRFTAESLALRKEKRLATPMPPERVQEVLKIYDAVTPADSLPRFDALLAASDGTLWAKEYNTASRTRWYVFGQAGEWLGSVDVPERFTVHAIANDRVYGIARDADDVERVQVLRLAKRP